jgi:hypothetical protein
MKNAFRLVETATGGALVLKQRKHRKNPHAVTLGRKGGLKVAQRVPRISHRNSAADLPEPSRSHAGKSRISRCTTYSR